VPYSVQFTVDALRDVKALPKNVRNTLAKELKGKLAINPAGCSQELRDPLVGWRSFHCGKYRVIFKPYPDMKIVAVAGIGKHSGPAAQDVYRRLELLAKSGRLAEGVLAVLRGISKSEE
jgi:mRNA-degrading endonuclease RelE of RelBE toxin-antitoxin system